MTIKARKGGARLTRIPGDFPNEGRVAAMQHANTESSPTQPVFHRYEIGGHLRCTRCGNQVRVEEIGGGHVECCNQSMDPL